MGTSLPANRIFIPPTPADVMQSISSGDSSPSNRLKSKSGKSNALFGGLSTCAGLVKGAKDLAVVRSKKPSVGIIPWVSAAVLGGALLVGVPAGIYALVGSAGTATLASSLSAVPAASTATIAGPLLPSLGALATIIMNSADTDGKLIAGDKKNAISDGVKCSSNSLTTSSNARKKNVGNAGVAFSAFANTVFNRGRRRAF